MCGSRSTRGFPHDFLIPFLRQPPPTPSVTNRRDGAGTHRNRGRHQQGPRTFSHFLSRSLGAPDCLVYRSLFSRSRVDVWVRSTTHGGRNQNKRVQVSGTAVLHMREEEEISLECRSISWWKISTFERRKTLTISPKHTTRPRSEANQPNMTSDLKLQYWVLHNIGTSRLTGEYRKPPL